MHVQARISLEAALLEVKDGKGKFRKANGNIFLYELAKLSEEDQEEIKAFRASMVEGTPSSGGFSVPEPLAAKWLDDSLQGEVIRPRATA